MMRRFLLPSCAALLLTAGACGDSASSVPDARIVVDAVQLETPPCDGPSYPLPIERVRVELTHPFTLTLDGEGTRCEQILRVLTGPDAAMRPPELDRFDVTDITSSTCEPDANVATVDAIRLRSTRYDGRPLYGFTQEVIVLVDRAKPAVTYLGGEFLAAGAVTNAACLDATQVANSIPGRSLAYARFDACLLVGEGSYTIANDDIVEVADEGYFVDAGAKLHRVRAVDVYLLGANITPEFVSGNAYCCNGYTLERCAGERLFVDVVTGESVGDAPYCITC